MARSSRRRRPQPYCQAELPGCRVPDEGPSPPFYECPQYGFFYRSGLPPNLCPYCGHIHGSAKEVTKRG